MRIAVYTIALNEEKHVKRWYESAKDADYLLIADTGSTDKTVEIAESLGNYLDATQASDFYTAVQAFQTTLARQIAP